MRSRRRQTSAAVSVCLILVHRASAWVVTAVPAQRPRHSRPPAPVSREGHYAAPGEPGRRRKTQCAAASWPLFAAAAAAAAAAPDTAAPHAPSRQQSRSAKRAAVSSNNLQSVDFTTALLMSRELEQSIVPARVENAYQMDAHNVALQLRTLDGNMWLHVCWHPKGAR